MAAHADVETRSYKLAIAEYGIVTCIVRLGKGKKSNGANREESVIYFLILMPFSACNTPARAQ